MKIPKELIKEFVGGENFKNTNDILASVKSMFVGVLEYCIIQFVLVT